MRDDEKDREYQLIQRLAEIVNELGWVIALPTNAESVPGLIIGTEEFAKEVMLAFYGPSHDIFKEDPTGMSSLVEIETTIPNDEFDELEELIHGTKNINKKYTLH